MKQKNFVIEVIEGGEASRTYIVRELPVVPNQPAPCVAVCSSGDELAQFFDNLKIN